MAAPGSISIGRGPDGTNIRVNNQGTGIPFGTPAKAASYNPGTAAQRLAIRMMQERARKRVRAGGPAQNGFTYQQNMAEWNAAQAEANAHLEEARRRYAATPKRRPNALTDEFELDEFLPTYLQADRTALKKRGADWDPFDVGPGKTTMRTDSGVDLALGTESRSNLAPMPDLDGRPPQEADPLKPGLIYGSDAPGDVKLDPTLEKYKQLRAQWLDASSKGEGGAPDTGADGDFGTSGSGSTSTSMGVSENTGFRFFLVGEGGDKTIEKDTKLYTKLVAEALRDPFKAGELMASMVALGAYGGGAEKFVQDRLYLARDPKTGQATLKGRFTEDDLKALKATMAMISADQANLADSVIANGGSVKDIPGFEELLAQRGIERQDMAATSDAAGSSGGGGGGGGFRRGGGGYGGGGGGGGGAARLTDVEQLKSLADGIARQRLGRVLTVEEAQAFADYYHTLERQSYSAYQTGMGGTMLDAESQAVAWIESRYRGEGARQQQGQYVTKLLQMLQSGAWSGGGE